MSPIPFRSSSGHVDYGIKDVRGQEITTKNIRDYWFRRISYIPQSSMSSLNPVIRIRKQFVDFLPSDQDKAQVLDEVRAYIRQLDLPSEALDAYPHQLSGGMRQRIMVAMATFFQPDIILADEPTTALDVVVQKGILLLLMELQEQMQNTIFFVSHDMGVHYQITHKMMIMYTARAVEYGDSEAVFVAAIASLHEAVGRVSAYDWRCAYTRRGWQAVRPVCGRICAVAALHHAVHWPLISADPWTRR